MRLKIIRFKFLQSTNAKSIKLIGKNQLKPTIVFTKSQLNGKGTRGKKWVSIKGNIFLSIYFKIKIKNENIKQFTMLNACILKNILQKYVKKNIHIKKPNDILIDKKKICGILQEIVYFNNNKYIIIGIGINTLKPILSQSFKASNLQEFTRKKINNNSIIKDIKNAYELFISDIRRYNFNYLKKKYK